MATSADEIYIQCEPVSDVDNNIVIEEVNQIRIIGGSTISTDASGQDMDTVEKTFKKSQENVKKLMWTIFGVIGIIMINKLGNYLHEKYKNILIRPGFIFLSLIPIVIISLVWGNVF